MGFFAKKEVVVVSSKCVTLKRSGGFYQAFGNDALIIGYLFDYKVNNRKCGFPLIALNKVVNELEEKSISYYIKDKEIKSKDFKKKNKYDLYLEKSVAKDNINKRIQFITDKISLMDKDRLENLLTLIEDNINE